MDPDFLDILACPVCKGKLDYKTEPPRLICRIDRLKYSITADGIPVLLADEATPLAEKE